MQSTLNNSSASVGMDVFPPTASLSVTEAAVFKIWELVQEEGNVDLSLRVFISGGGCSGFEYGFSFDETVNEDDSVLTLPIEQQNSGANQVRVLVDPMSLQYLVGAEIDYQSDVQGEQFIIRNPNAKTTCGCGSSFSV